MMMVLRGTHLLKEEEDGHKEQLQGEKKDFRKRGSRFVVQAAVVVGIKIYKGKKKKTSIESACCW